MKEPTAQLDPVFEIEEDDSKQKYEFVLDEKGNPVKLGDGSYGVVYNVRRREEELAVKLFYSEPMNTKSKAVELTPDHIKEFVVEFEIEKDNPVLKNLKKIEKKYGSFAELAYALRSIDLEEEHYVFFADRCQGAADSGVQRRYKHEKESAELIRRKLREKGEYDALKGVIQIEGGTDRFRSSDAYARLKDYFTEAQMSISDYAIVMPRYRYTLKDLLVKPTGNFAIRPSAIKRLLSQPGAPVSHLQHLGTRVSDSKTRLLEEIDSVKKFKTELEEGIYELKGYDLLKAMGYSDRISTILPYLLNISQGLMALHLANKFHYDLKPANIFVKSSGGEVEAVIGDLGFFMISEDIPTSSYDTNTRESLPLGTRHYRSPEQKDYFDICDVEINEEGELIVRDPKFEDTIIESGDYVVFSRDSSREKYFIESINLHSEMSVVKLRTNNNLAKKPKTDSQTQAIFFKQQKLRTDLFGFGAIVYDMLTGGKSPERFYDKIRSFDKETEDVKKILDQYKQVSSYQVTDPSLIHMFSDFKNEEKADYAPEEIVELILMCMLYKAQNTYYQIHRDSSQTNEYYKSMEDVLYKLKRVDEKYQNNKWDNPLLNEKYPGYRGQGQSNFLETNLFKIEELKLPDVCLRLAQGYWYFAKLAEMIRGDILESRDNAFIVELLPRNIIVEKDRLKYSFIAYKNENDYKKDLRQDLVYAKITRDINNPFVPNNLAFMRRKILLRPVSDKKNTFEYRFLESTLLGDSINKNDWIIIGSELYKIIDVSAKRITLQNDDSNLIDEDIRVGDESPSMNDSVHTFYQNLDPCTYYLQMLGIYLYHIFFVGFSESTKNKPLIITIAQSARHLSNLPEPIRLSGYEMPTRENSTISSIFRFLSYMYVKLVFTDHKESYYQKEKDDRQRILAVLEDISWLKDFIASVLSIRSVVLDSLVSDFNREPEAKKKQQEIIDKSLVNEDDLDFETLVRSLIDISLDKRKLWRQKMQEHIVRLLNRLKPEKNTNNEDKSVLETAENKETSIPDSVIDNTVNRPPTF